MTLKPVTRFATLAFCALALLVPGLHAATFLVNTNADSGPGTLRQAVADAAAAPGPDGITFAPGLSGQSISLTSQITITDPNSLTVGASGLPDGLTINDGTNTSYRLFEVQRGASLTLHGLALVNGGGSDFTGYGGAIYNAGELRLTHCKLFSNSVSGSFGGAIYNFGGNSTLTSGSTLSLTDCTLVGNSGGVGGAIHSFLGTLTLTRCILSGNLAIFGSGGAIYSYTSPAGGPSSTTLSHCTLTGNAAGTRSGAIRNRSGLVTLTHCTVSGNTAPVGTGGGVSSHGGFDGVPANTVVKYSIIAGNVNSDVDFTAGAANTFSSLGFNIIGTGNATANFNQSGDLTGITNPLLSPLDNYGGPTKTMALLPGCPARNAAVGSTATNDQRGFPIVGTPDIGAYEAGTFSNFNAFIWESLPTTNTAAHAASFDYDADGASNYDEWLAQTDPSDAASSFYILSIQPMNEFGVIVHFSTVTNRTYTLWHSEDLTNWLDSGLAPVPGDGFVRSFTAGPSTNATRRFYKLQAEP